MRRLDPAPRAERIVLPTSNEWLQAVTERFGVFHGAIDPTIDELPNNQWILFKNTGTGEVAFFFNDDGVVRKVTLSGTGIGSHHTTHEAGGSDAIKLDDLAAPDDNTDLDVSTAKHGLFPKLPNTGSKFWRDDGTWQTIASGGDVVGPAGAVNNRVVFFDGVTGKLIKDSGLTLSGSNTGDQTITLTSDVTGSGTGSFATTIANNAVTYAKMQDVTATSRLIGRKTAGAGDPEEITMSEGLAFIGNTQGMILYRDGSGWNVLSAGTSGQVLQTGGAGANPAWATHKEVLANVTLGSAGTSLSSGTISARKFLEVHIYIAGYAASETASLQFNADTGNNYRYRWLTSASGATTFAAGLIAASTDRVKIDGVNTARSRRVVAFISNDSSNTEKLVNFSSVLGTISAATQSSINLGNGAWISAASTSITQIDLITTGGSNMNAGTQMVIYGWN